MSKTRNNDSAKKASERFARKNRRALRTLGLEIGDRIRIIDISPALKDPGYDLQDAEHREMRTGELFRFCLGRESTVRAFGRYGTVELEAGANREVRRKFGKYHTIWMEPEYLEIVRKKRTTRNRGKGLSK